MRTIVAAALLCVMLALLLPLLFSGGGQAEPEAEREAEGAGELDSELAFTVLTEGEVKTVTMSDWLPGVVAGEMPASFEPEALKAQTVAARTYTLSKLARTSEKHPDADVCTDITCCQAYITPEEAAVNWGDRKSVV